MMKKTSGNKSDITSFPSPKPIICEPDELIIPYSDILAQEKVSTNNG